MSFAELNAWTFVMVFGALLAGMLVGAAVKHLIPGLKKTLVPISVLGGIVLLILSTVVYFAAGDYLFNLPAFGDGSDGAMTGMQVLELVTYHCLGIGFVASGMRNSKKKFTKKRAGEVFDSGVLTVNGYLIQAFAGLIITLIAVCFFHVDGMISAAGILLAFGFGQGTGQALNYGTIYENQYGFEGGANFGLTVAALGFLVACIGGVIYINVMRRRGLIKIDRSIRANTLSDYEGDDELPMVSSVDKMTVQFALVLTVYALSFGIMYGLALLIPSMADTLFGFNFLIGVMLTIPAKMILNKLHAKKIVEKQMINNFMMDRISGLAFDIMIVAGVAAIQIPLLFNYWGVLLLLAVAGTFLTYFYVNFICKRLFPAYRHEQFLAWFGMLTGTASTGMILLREIDGTYRTPASENLVYQNLPAIVFGFPLMFLATYAPTGDLASLITCIVVGVAFIALNIVLFRRSLFKRFRPAPAGAGTAGELPDGEAPSAEEADAPTDGPDEG